METMIAGDAAPQVVVLGDINLDWAVKENLAFSFAELSENGRIVWQEVDEVPGGSGLSFAKFAQRAGFHTMLIGRVGSDSAGRFLQEWLDNEGIAATLSVDTVRGTGRAFMVRDQSDVRLLVNDRENANHGLTIEDIERASAALLNCQILYVSGYCIMHSNAPRTAATLRAISLARERAMRSASTIVFDVVPHRIYEFYSLEQLQTLTEGVDIVISEVATMRRLLRVGTREEIVDRRMAQETLALLKGYYSGIVLRFGPSGCDEQLLWDSRRGEVRWEKTGHAQAPEKRGFGDMLAVRCLQEFFGVPLRWHWA